VKQRAVRQPACAEDDEKMIRAHVETQEAITRECETTGQKYLLWAKMILHNIEKCVILGAWDETDTKDLFTSTNPQS